MSLSPQVWPRVAAIPSAGWPWWRELPVHRFVRHAERFGCDEVFETAACVLGPRELSALSLALQRVDRRWRMAQHLRRELALALLERGEGRREVCDVCQLTSRTVVKLREEDVGHV